MTWREQFELMVGIYVAALGADKPLSMRQTTIESGFRVTRDLVGNTIPSEMGGAQRAAYAYVCWKFGLGARPGWALE